MSLAAVQQEVNNKDAGGVIDQGEEDIVVPIDPAAAAAATSGSETVNNGLVSEHEEDTNDAVEDDDEGSDDESEYEYEDEDETAFGGFLDKPEAPQLQPARIEDDSNSSTAVSTTTPKVVWREPSQAAVNMSLRAEQETTGGKRRLASDLYKIMTADTDQAGFSLEPKCEDSMKLWTIKLFQFDEDSNLAKDLKVLNLNHVELEMSFPDQYPFEPPFCRVVRPKFKKQSGFVMNGALCMELLTKDGWNPVNDIESVIVSIRSLLVVGDGRVQAAVDMGDKERDAILARLEKKRSRSDDNADEPSNNKKQNNNNAGGSYSMAEAQAAYTHLSDYHKKKGWDKSGWWRKKG